MSKTNGKNLCECYKKLSSLGIPLYKSDENYEYGEEREETEREKAFPVPEFIRIDEKCQEYPVVGDADLSVVFECMSQVIIGVSDFEINVLSFWILDMFIEGLWTAQNIGMKHDHQKATLLWIAYFFNYILKRNPTRKQLFRHLKEILFLPEGRDNGENSDATVSRDSGDYCSNMRNKQEPDADDDRDGWPQVLMKKDMWNLPLPPVLEELNHCYEELSSKTSQSSYTENMSMANSTSTPLSTAESISELNVTHMNVILDILYRIFGRLWVYLEIQSTLHNMPNVEIIDLPFKLHTPKLKAPPKVEPVLPVKGGKKGTVPEKSPEEIEAERQLHKDDYILPLQDSDEAKAIALQLFGLPPSDKKGKGDKNK